jgi:hypothetical protein
MPAMTEPDAPTAASGVSGAAGPSGPDAGDPRRVVLADLVARLVAGVTARARAYDAAAGQAEGDLKQALDRLGRAKHAQAVDLLPLARALGASVPSAPPPGCARHWGVVLGEAFQGERDLEWTSRELAVLAGDPAIKALAARLAGGAARDAEEVRKLYLRYS